LLFARNIATPDFCDSFYLEDTVFFSYLLEENLPSTNRTVSLWVKSCTI
jgi:hypothetical protein